MTCDDLQKRFSGAGRMSSSLLPLLQRSRRNSECSGELRLRQTALQTRRNDIVRLDLVARAMTPRLDIANRLQQFLTDVPLGVARQQLFLMTRHLTSPRQSVSVRARECSPWRSSRK